MNYAAAVAAVSIFLAALNWYFFFRKHYTVPRALYIEGFSGTYLEWVSNLSSIFVLKSWAWQREGVFGKALQKDHQKIKKDRC